MVCFQRLWGSTIRLPLTPTFKNDEPVNVGCEAFYIIRFNITAVNGHTDPYDALQLGVYAA